MSARCAFIQAHQGEHPIRRLCQVLGVSRAGYYVWHRRQRQGPGPRAAADGALAQTIQQVQQGVEQTVPKVTEPVGGVLGALEG